MKPERLFGRSIRWPSRSRWLVLLVSLTVASTFSLPAQEPEHYSKSSVEDSSVRRFRFGASAGYSTTTFNRFNVFSSGSGCGQFEGGTNNPFVKVFIESPLDSTEHFWLNSSLRVRRMSTELHSGTTTFESVLPNGTSVEVVQQYRMDISMIAVGAGIGPTWEFLPNYRISITPSVSWLSSSGQNWTEQILEPLGWAFTETGGPARPIEGNLSVRPIQFDLDASLSARLQVGRRLALLPEVEVGIPLTSIARDFYWNGISFRAAFGFTFDVMGHREPPRQVVEPVVQSPDTVQSETPAQASPHLSAAITARGIDAQGREYDDPVIEIEEAPWTESMPVIPYVFFAEGSAQIPDRYTLLDTRRRTERYYVDSLIGVDAIDVHHELLNVLGMRLREHPVVSATITGTTSGDEKNQGALGLERARAVRAYLVDIWGIDSSRLSVASSARATPPSNEETTDGREENRRVEFTFSDATMLEPVVIHRLARVATPPAIHFYPDIIADTTVVEWSITVLQGEKELLRLEGDADQNPAGQKKLWSLADLRVNKDFTPIGYQLDVRDIVGNEATAKGVFQVSEHVRVVDGDSLKGQLEVVEFNLVGFNFNSADLLTRHFSQLPLIAESITDGAQVQIDGYTDRLGDPERNVQLSLERANGVGDALNVLLHRLNLPKPSSMIARGHGHREQPFDNTLPEGRMLSRMVRVTISRHLAR